MNSGVIKLPRKKVDRNFGLKKEDFPDYKSYKKEYDRLYSLHTRERRKQIYKENSEYKNNQHKEWCKNNPEKMKIFNQKRNNEYYTNPSKRKISLINGWRRAGIKIFEGTFEYYENTTHCESCGCELLVGKGTGKNKKQLDHCHHSGYGRHIICQSCNCWRRGRDARMDKVHLELYRYFNLKK